METRDPIFPGPIPSCLPVHSDFERLVLRKPAAANNTLLTTVKIITRPPRHLSALSQITVHIPMSSAAFARFAVRARTVARPACRVQKQTIRLQPATCAFSTSTRKLATDTDPHDPHHEESFEEFTARYATPVGGVTTQHNGYRGRGRKKEREQFRPQWTRPLVHSKLIRRLC